jgi:repressor of nif and glnA expression
MTIARLSDTERKKFHILRALAGARRSLGARVIARYLWQLGIELSEDTVRYHLRMMDESGLTRLVARRDGRELTARGLAELHHLQSNQGDFTLPEAAKLEIV